ncbi:MAG TPA: alpha/beta hydrolase, partial [Lacipirellulaceae bacterium]|nr:alpha/beta hydrolase [Lacipirellulaceae bacterium]
SENQIRLIGHMLGVAVALAAEQGARALVLENTFSKMTDAAAYLYPWLPVRIVMSNRYNSVRRIKSYHGPVHQCHGTADDIVPIELGRRLFDAAPGRMKHFYEVPYGGHNDSPPPAYYAALSNFLEQVDEHRRVPARLRQRGRQLVS